MRCRWLIILCVLFAGLSMVAERPSRRYHSNIQLEGSDSIMINSSAVAIKRNIEVRSSDPFSIFWMGKDSIRYQAWIDPRMAGNAHTDDDFYVRYSLSMTGKDGDVKSLTSREMRVPFEIDRGNTLAVETDSSGRVMIMAGSRRLQVIDSLSVNGIPSIMGVSAPSRSLLNGVIVEEVVDPAEFLATSMTIDSILTAANRYIPGSPVGVWEYMDRENDPRYLRPGGRYRLAVVPDKSDGYMILYLSGAAVNNMRWKPGMIKGRLRPTIFADNFDLQWYDATMQPLSDENYASLDLSGNLLSLHFPLLKGKVRFSRAVNPSRAAAR